MQLPGRQQFVHVIFAPQAWSGYEEAYFPGSVFLDISWSVTAGSTHAEKALGVRDAIDNDDWELAQAQVEKVARIISYASHKLNR